jgi:hypothetical protein
MQDLLSRFERHYIPEPNSGCWLWTGCLYGDGYGHFDTRRSPLLREQQAHRFAYRFFKGPVPKGLQVQHSCDMRCCVNPDHLKLGTPKQNTADAIQRKRFATGVRHPHRKLTDAQRASIINDVRRYVDIAAEYGVSITLVSFLKSGRRS